MRGIEFYADMGYCDILDLILKDISTETMDFYISQEEIICEKTLPDLSVSESELLLKGLRDCAPYLVLFLNLQAYPKGKAPQKIKSYEEFLKSSCSFALLITDCRCFEIYVKDETLLLQFIKNAIAIQAKDITIKTDYDDGRYAFSIV